MTKKSLGELLIGAKVLQRLAKRSKDFYLLNTMLIEILDNHLEKVTVSLETRRTHDWDSRFAVLQIKYGNFSFTFPVPELKSLAPDLAKKTRRKIMNKFLKNLNILWSNEGSNTKSGKNVRFDPETREMKLTVWGYKNPINWAGYFERTSLIKEGSSDWWHYAAIGDPKLFATEIHTPSGLKSMLENADECIDFPVLDNHIKIALKLMRSQGIDPEIIELLKSSLRCQVQLLANYRQQMHKEIRAMRDAGALIGEPINYGQEVYRLTNGFSPRKPAIEKFVDDRWVPANGLDLCRRGILRVLAGRLSES